MTHVNQPCCTLTALDMRCVQRNAQAITLLPCKSAAVTLHLGLPQKEEADTLESDTYEALVATPERGADFAAAVRSVLADETHWVAWKRDTAPDTAGRMVTCGSFQRPPYQEPATLQKGRGKRPGGALTGSISTRVVVKRLPSPGGHWFASAFTVLHNQSMPPKPTNSLCLAACLALWGAWELASPDQLCAADVPQLPPSRRKRPRTDAEPVRIDDGPLDDLFNQARNNMDGLEVGVACMLSYFCSAALSSTAISDRTCETYNLTDS